MKAEGQAFRVRLELDYGTGFDPSVFYHGPYATLGTARAQVTRLQSRYEYWLSRGVTHTLTVEKSATSWEEVPA